MAQSFNRKDIPIAIQRKLYAESMGRCMNPDCCHNLFIDNIDISEKAHIVGYCETEDNSFYNLILLCPNCHTFYDKGRKIDEETVIKWKKNRDKDLQRFFDKRFETFEDLKKEIQPYLFKNKEIFDQYFCGESKKLWDEFEPIILSNNEIIKNLLENNLDLFQFAKTDEYSNKDIINRYIAHIDEFKVTRTHEEKIRKILFPKEVNSIFDIEPICSSDVIPFTESIEELIKMYKAAGIFNKVVLDVDNPYISLVRKKPLYLSDSPRIRQILADNKIFCTNKMPLTNIVFVLKWLKNRKIPYEFVNDVDLRIIKVNGYKIKFVYEYCLTRAFVEELSPEPNSIVCNIYRWNGELCISKDASKFANENDIILLNVDSFYEFFRKKR